MSIVLFLLILILTLIGYKYYFGRNVEHYDNSSTQLLPSYFLSHSNPSLPLEPDVKLHRFLRAFQRDQLRAYAKPKGIVVLSAHQVAQPHRVSLTPKQLFDFSAFTGAPDTQTGMDHGTWVPLMLMFPRADIPVVTVSLHPALDAQYHVTLGQALAPLRREGILIIGSGQATHGLADEGAYWIEDRPAPWSVTFDDWLTRVLTALTGDERRRELVNFAKTDVAARAHPPGRTEHLIPLLVNLGTLSSDSASIVKLHGSYQGNLSMSCFAFH